MPRTETKTEFNVYGCDSFGYYKRTFDTIEQVRKFAQSNESGEVEGVDTTNTTTTVYNYHELSTFKHGPVDVVFVKEPGGSVLAVFPGLAGSADFSGDCTCYARIGQHSHCDIGYAADECTEADSDEYAELKRELEGIGYDLYVVSQCRIKNEDYTDQRRRSCKF